MFFLKILDKNLLVCLDILDNNQLWRIRCNVRIYPLKQSKGMILDFESGLRTQRAYRLFKSAINSQKTLKKYDDGVLKFMNRFGYADYDSILLDDSETIQKHLEDYVMDIKVRTNKRSTIKGHLQPIELFLEVNKKMFHKRALHLHYPKDIMKTGNDLPYSNEDVLKFLKIARTKRSVALVHFFASTGARPNAISDPTLKFKHITPMPFGCKAVLLYSGSNEEYWGFLTPESSKALDDYTDERIYQGEKITKESPIFVSREKHQEYNPDTLGVMTSETLHSLFVKLIERSRIERYKIGNRFDKGLFLGFRKRFNTILKIDSNVNSNIAEKLMAHKKGLDGVYFKPTREDCFREFRKAIPQLTLSESEKLKLEVNDLTENNDTIIKQYEDRISRTETLLKRVLERLDSS